MRASFQPCRVDRDRSRTICADENRANDVCLKSPHPRITEHALRFEIGDHGRRPHPLNRWTAFGTIEAHHPDRPSAIVVLPEYPQIADKVTRSDPELLAGIEGSDLVCAFEAVSADGIDRLRHVELVRVGT